MTGNGEEQFNRHLAWFEAHGVQRFDLGVRRRSGVFISRAAACDRVQVTQLRNWLAAENVAGGDVYIRPARNFDWPLAFLDDVTLNDAVRLAREVCCLAVQTSAGSCHVWIATDTPLAEDGRAQVQRTLAQRGGERGTFGDLASVSGEHFGRLAGYRNQKPGRDFWVAIAFASRVTKRLAVQPLLGDAESPPVMQEPSRVSTIRRSAPLVLGGMDRSASGEDWALAMRALERGCDVAELVELLVDRARARGKRAPEDYARRTAQGAMAKCAERQRFGLR